MGKIQGEMDAAIRRTGMTTFELSDLIDTWIFSARDRKLLKWKFCHHMTYEAAAERAGMSTIQVKRIVKTGFRQLKAHF